MNDIKYINIINYSNIDNHTNKYNNNHNMITKLDAVDFNMINYSRNLISNLIWYSLFLILIIIIITYIIVVNNNPKNRHLCNISK